MAPEREDMIRFLRELLDCRVEPEGEKWLGQQLERLESKVNPDRSLATAVSLASRKLGKNDLAVTPEELQRAIELRPRWNPRAWTVDQAARVLFVLAVPGSEADRARRLDELCRTADVAELVAFYRGLPLYPEPELYIKRAEEGMRTNMRAVFEAVAHDNPFAAEQFDRDAWNQLVLKALFVDSRLFPIVGLEERANPELARMLCDYAHERWAAHRRVPAELWRCVGPHADDDALTDLQGVLSSADVTEQQAAALALSCCPHPRATEILAGEPELAGAVERGDLNWNRIGCEA